MQRKLTLRLEDLTVDSFRTSPGEPAKGTVFGEQYCTCPTACTCPGCPTCDATCPNTCPASCDGSCDSCQGTCWEETCAVECNRSKYTNCDLCV